MKNSTILKISTILLLFLITINTSFATFSDVSIDHKYYEAINYLQENNIIKGYTDNTFRPEQEVTRAEFLKIVMEGSNINLSSNINLDFSDVKTEDWFYPYLRKAKENGWINGYTDGTFKANQTIIKAEALKIIGEIQNWPLKNPTIKPFNDVEIDAWYASYISYAKESNYLYDQSNLFLPLKNLNRSEISEIIYRSIIFKTQPSPTDSQNNFEKTFFNEINLTENIPKIYYKDEIYYLYGTVNNDTKYVTTILKNTITLETTQEKHIVENKQFYAPIHFEKSGIYYLGLLAGENGESKAIEIEVKPKFPEITNLELPQQSSNNTNFTFKNDKAFLELEKADNTIKKLELTQSNQSITLYSRQNISFFEMNYKNFKNFQEGNITYNLSTAKISNSNPLIINSNFSQTENKIVTATTHQFTKNTYEEITVNPPSKIDTKKIEFTGTTLSDTYITAYVIKPDGFVDEIQLTTNATKYTHLNNEYIKKDNNFTFSYLAEKNGTYIVEINNTEGIALLNHPIYIGPSIPLIPEYFDLNTSSLFTENFDEAKLQNQLLTLINNSRTQYNLPPLTLDSKLNTLAKNHSQNMIDFNFISHIDQEGNSPNDRRINAGIKTPIGENISKDTSIKTTHEGLMRSASHRQNILFENWTKIGIGIVLKDGYLTITEDFSTDEETITSLLNKQTELENKINKIRSENNLTPLTISTNLNNASKDLNTIFIREKDIPYSTFINILNQYNITGTQLGSSKTHSFFDQILKELETNEEILNNTWKNIGTNIQIDELGNYNIFILFNTP